MTTPKRTLEDLMKRIRMRVSVKIDSSDGAHIYEALREAADAARQEGQREELEALRAILSDAQCACSVLERYSGHRIGCYRPEIEDMLCSPPDMQKSCECPSAGPGHAKCPHRQTRSRGEK